VLSLLHSNGGLPPGRNENDDGEAMEAIARLEAEGRLIKRHDAEYRRLAGKHGHIRAVVRLVAAHKREYDGLIRTARDGVAARAGIEAA